MKDDPPRSEIDFTLSESAQNYVLQILPKFAETLSKRGLDLAFNWVGSGRTEKNRKVIWEYTGPFFMFGGRKPGERTFEKPYNLLGYTVWMMEMDTLLLNGRVLTLMSVGSPEPHAELVIENAPDDYFQKFTQEDSGDRCCCNPHGKHGV